MDIDTSNADQNMNLEENIRFSADMGFNQLTLFFAGLTVSAAGAAQYWIAILLGSITVRAVAAGFELLFTALMWVMEVKSTEYAIAHLDLAGDRWPHPISHSQDFINSIDAILVLYLTVYCFWCVVAWNWIVPGHLLGSQLSTTMEI
jgi:hypothetical protein